MNIRLACTAVALCLGVASLDEPTARASGTHVMSGALACAITPSGTVTPNGCKSVVPGFSFDAYFSLTSAPPASFQAEWSITAVHGDPPQVASGCGSTSSYCDLLLTTTASGDTQVSVSVNIYAMPAHTLALTGSALARVPCTTIKPPNHPTSC
jgi:hypothetical protein